MAYSRGRRTPLKRRPTYGRGTRRYNQARYRRAYFNKRRGVGRKEKKGCDVAFATEQVVATTNTNDNVYLLNGIQEGVGSWNRIGRYMWNKSIEVDLDCSYLTQIDAGDTSSNPATWLRCLVVWDKQPNNGTKPTFDTIFGHTTQAGVESSSVTDHLRYDNMFRFQVLMDQEINPTLTSATSDMVEMPGTGTVRTITNMRFHKFLKLGNKLTNFSGTANPVTTANISTGALYLILRSPLSNSQDGWFINDISTARLRYVD